MSSNAQRKQKPDPHKVRDRPPGGPPGLTTDGAGSGPSVDPGCEPEAPDKPDVRDPPPGGPPG